MLLSRRSFVSAATAIAVAAGARRAAFADATAGTALRFATVAPAGSSFHQRLTALSAEWQKGPGGVHMDLYPGTQGGESQIVRRLRVGQIQGAMLTSEGLGQIEPAVTALQYMPLMFRNWEEVDYARDAVRADLEARLAKAGYVVLIWGDAGWVRFFSKAPVRSYQDLKTLRIYASSSNPASLEMLKPYYTPVALDPDKILLALRNGLIDAIPIPASLANFNQVPSQAPYMLDMRWAPVTGALIVSKRAWDSLDAASRDWVKAACDKAAIPIRQASRAEDDASVKAMQEKQGLKVTTLTAEAEAEWRTLAAKAYPQIRGKLVPEATFDQVLHAVQTYRASHR